MNNCHVEIKMTGHGRGQVWVDGVKVPEVRAVSVNARANEVNSVTIEMIPDSLIYSGAAELDRFTRERICEFFSVPLDLIPEPIEYGIGAYCRYNEARCR